MGRRLFYKQETAGSIPAPGTIQSCPRGLMEGRRSTKPGPKGQMQVRVLPGIL